MNEHPISVSRSRNFHASVVVNEQAIKQIVDTLTNVGWYLDEIRVEARGGRKASFKTVPDFENAPPALWRNLQELSFSASPADEEYSFSAATLSFERTAPPWIGRPTRIWVNGPESKVVVVEQHLEELVEGLAQWYSPLSRGLWWNVLMWVVGLLPLIHLFMWKWTGVALLGKSLAYLWWWVPLWLLTLLIAQLGIRYFLFPSVVVDIGHAKGTADVYVARRKRALQIIGAVSVAVMSAVIAKLLH